MSTILLIANIALVLGALGGMLCIAHKDKRGFIIFLGVELSMGYIGWTTSNYGLIIAALLYFMMNIYSFIMWTKQDLQTKRRETKKISH